MVIELMENLMGNVKFIIKMDLCIKEKSLMIKDQDLVL